MENNLKSILYMTVNTINNNIYIGVHITETPYEFDNYWGDGITGTSSYHFKHPKCPFQRACKKYGLDAFKRYTLMVFDTYDEALAMEKIIVNEEFVARPDTYNVALGGGSGLVPSVEKEVHKYNLDGEFIQSYRSYSDAARKNNVKYPSIIHAVLNKGICAGFYWSEIKTMKLDLTDAKKSSKKLVYVYDASGNYLYSEESISAYAKRYEVGASSVRRAINGKTKSAGNYVSFEKFDKFEIVTKKIQRNRKIYQYTKDGEFVQEHLNSTRVAMYLKEPVPRLNNYINSQQSYKNYLWSYEKYDKFPITVKPHSRKVAQYDLEGNLVKI